MGIFRAENILSAHHPPPQKKSVTSFHTISSVGLGSAFKWLWQGFSLHQVTSKFPHFHNFHSSTLQSAPRCTNEKQRAKNKIVQFFTTSWGVPASFTHCHSSCTNIRFLLSFPNPFNLFFKISVVFFTSGNNFCLLKVSLEEARRLQVF